MTELQTLLPTLQSIDASRLRPANLPMAVALQEANDLRVVLDDDETWDRLVAVGVDAATIERLPVAIEATRQAQSQWVVIRDRTKPEAQREREQAGERTRSDLE